VGDVLSAFGAVLLAAIITAGLAIALSVYSHAPVPHSNPIYVLVFLWSLAACWTTMRN
jgi:hypothetical protein